MADHEDDGEERPAKAVEDAINRLFGQDRTPPGLRRPKQKPLDLSKLPVHPFECGDVVRVRNLGGPDMLVVSTGYVANPLKPMLDPDNAGGLIGGLQRASERAAKEGEQGEDFDYKPTATTLWFNTRHEVQTGDWRCEGLVIVRKCDDEDPPL